MVEQPLKSVFFHFRFKFLAITAIAFLIYAILSGGSELDQFSSSLQFKLMGPFLIGSGILFLIFRKFPIKCPYCARLIRTQKDWTCPSCSKDQGSNRYLIDKCVHCKQTPATATCDHCKKEFRL